LVKPLHLFPGSFYEEDAIYDRSAAYRGARIQMLNRWQKERSLKKEKRSMKI